MSTVVLAFEFGKNPPPADVLIEHVAFAVRNDFKETELVAVRNHPFEGPEVFDDVVTEETFKEVLDGLNPWPTIDEVVKSLRNPDQ